MTSEVTRQLTVDKRIDDTVYASVDVTVNSSYIAVCRLVRVYSIDPADVKSMLKSTLKSAPIQRNAKTGTGSGV